MTNCSIILIVWKAKEIVFSDTADTSSIVLVSQASHWCSQCSYLTVVLVETMVLSHLSTVSKAVVLLEEDEGKKNKVPGKRAVTASVNSWAILGSAQSCIGAPPRPASCHHGDGCFITLLDGKSLEDWQVVHRSMAKLPWHGTVSLITSHCWQYSPENTQASTCVGHISSLLPFVVWLKSMWVCLNSGLQQKGKTAKRSPGCWKLYRKIVKHQYLFYWEDNVENVW